MPQPRKKIVYGVNGPTNYSWEARVLTRCREIGLSTIDLAKLGFISPKMIISKTDWHAYFLKRHSQAHKGKDKWRRQIDNKDKETQEKIKSIVHRAKGYCECCKRHIDDISTDPDLTPPMNRMCIDHCHETGEIRAYLCARCNMLEGMFAHDPKGLLIVYEHLNFKNS